MDRRLVDYSPETAMPALPGTARVGQDRASGVLGEAEEAELAADLLEVTSESEMDRFLGDLIGKAGWVAGRPVSAPTARALGSLLIDAARPTLPLVGSALGDRMAGAAGSLFGLELEGLSPEDRDFEIAKSFVRFAGEAARNAAGAPSRASPQAVANVAIMNAARRHAPGLLGATARAGPGGPFAYGPRPTGRWVRRGHNIIVVNGSPRRCCRSGRCRCQSAFAKEFTMHDTDRTQMEYAMETEFQPEQFEYPGEAEWGETEVLLTEADEIQLATELLEVTDEAELDQFLGNLIKKVGSVAGKVIRSPVGRAIGGVLKSAAKKALPVAGAALGGWVGGPLGAKIGSGLASAAGRAIGLEAETLSQEDREFEGAKQFVRLAADSVKKAAAAPPTADPRSVAQRAVMAAARQHAPGLLTAVAGGRGQSGRWVRRGTKVVLYGV